MLLLKNPVSLSVVPSANKNHDFGAERRLCVQNGSPEPQEPMVGILKCSVMLHNKADFYLFALSKEQCECGNAGKCGHYHVSRNDFCFGIAQSSNGDEEVPF